MSEPVAAADCAQLAVRCGLIDEHTSRELLYELDDNAAPATEFTKLLERKGLITPLQSSKLLKGETDGYFLGGYRVLYKIASGTFGRVYRGDDPRTGQIVAVKVLRRRWLDTPKRIESFEREGRLGMTLDHPNIVRILAVSKDQSTGQHFIVMEFVEGGNLRDILQIRKTIELDEALRIMEEAVAGLTYAYSRGLTHRDIKPTNILLSTDKTAKLVDFGLAEVNAGPEALIVGVKTEKDEQAERTVDYAGLERATGVKSGDIRSDIYFLGHVLFEMIAGKPILPHTKNAQTRMSRRRFEEVEPALEKHARELQIPGQVLRLITKAVALEPTQRYQTPAAFHEAIKACRAELAGKVGAGSSRQADGPPTIFVVESNPKLQNGLREKLKEFGLRVLMSIDPGQALKRYQTLPYHALLVNAGSVGKEGLDAFKRVVKEAEVMQLDCAAILVLSEEQRGWVDEAMAAGAGEVMVMPISMKVIQEILADAIPGLAKPDDAAEDDAPGDGEEE